MFALSNVILSNERVSQFSPLQSLHNRIASYPHTTSQVDATIVSFALSCIVAGTFKEAFMGLNTTYWGMTSAFVIHTLFALGIHGWLERYNHQNPWPKHSIAPIEEDKDKPVDEVEQSWEAYRKAQKDLDATVQEKQDVEREIQSLTSEGKKTKEETDLDDLKAQETKLAALVQDLNKIDDHLKKESELAALVRNHITIEDKIRELTASIETLETGTELSYLESQRLDTEIALISIKISEVQDQIKTNEGLKATANQEYSETVAALEDWVDLQENVTKKEALIEEEQKKLEELKEREKSPKSDPLSKQGPWDETTIASLTSVIAKFKDIKATREKQLSNIKKFYEELIIQQHRLNAEEAYLKKTADEAEKTSQQLQEEINEKRKELRGLEEQKPSKPKQFFYAINPFSSNEKPTNSPREFSQEEERDPPPTPSEQNIEEEIKSLEKHIGELETRKKSFDDTKDRCQTRLQVITGSSESKEAPKKKEKRPQPKPIASSSVSSHQATDYIRDNYSEDDLQKIPNLPKSTVDKQIVRIESKLLYLAESQLYDAIAKERKHTDLKKKCEEGNKNFPKEIEALEAKILAEKESLRSEKAKLETHLGEADIKRQNLTKVQKTLSASEILEKKLETRKASLRAELSQLTSYGKSSELQFKNTKLEEQRDLKRSSLISQGQALKRCSESRKTMLGRHREGISKDILEGIHKFVRKSERKLEGLKHLVNELEKIDFSSKREGEQPKKKELDGQHSKIVKALLTTIRDADEDIDTLKKLSGKLASEKKTVESKLKENSDKLQEASSKLSEASLAQEEKLKELQQRLTNLKKTHGEQYEERDTQKRKYEKEKLNSRISQKEEEIRKIRIQLLLAEKEHLEAKKVRVSPDGREALKQSKNRKLNKEDCLLQIRSLYEQLMEIEPNNIKKYRHKHLLIRAELELLEDAQTYHAKKKKKPPEGEMSVTQELQKAARDVADRRFQKLRLDFSSPEDSHIKTERDYLYFTLWLALSDLNSALELKRYVPSLNIQQEFTTTYKRRTPAIK